ncbi:MAG: hypothetical protein JSW54_03285 [Fidelibacterota bacterium]|nr:MAG: hypothetical protein JSW54_03285 [Candidatus Neomarinimicrobiota bacterium]
MKYTVYIFKCLMTGSHYLGVTHDLRGRFEELRSGGSWKRLTSPELLHAEQHDDLQMAQRRLQTIRRQWRPSYSLDNVHADVLFPVPSVFFKPLSLC